MTINSQKTELYFLLTILLTVFGITFFIFKPFIYTLILAVVFATTLDPLQKKFLKITHSKNSLASLLSTVFVFVVLIVPITFLSVQIFQEATQLYGVLTQYSNESALSQNNLPAITGIKHLLNLDAKVVIDFNIFVKQGLDLLIRNLGSVLSNVVTILIDTFIFLIALYYLFKDGKSIRSKLIRLSPLNDVYDEIIFEKLKTAVNSIVRGNLTVALVQGILTALGFIIFGVPSAALWGTVAAITALIPTFGTSIVIVPAVVFLFVSGNTGGAIGLLIWGMTAVGLIDNVLGPKLVGSGVKLHSFLVLLSILGGISVFGPIGFLLGPLTLSLFFTLFDIFVDIRKKDTSES